MPLRRDIVRRRRAPAVPVGLAALLCAAAAWAAPSVVRLDAGDARLPWAFAVVAAVRSAEGQAVPLAGGLADIDGEGVPELVIAEPAKIMAYDLDHGLVKPRWQHNVEAGWLQDPTAIELGPTLDLDGDGIQEIPYTAMRSDHGAWRYRVYDPDRGEVTVDAPLPMHPDRRREPWWDGAYHVAGVLKDPDGSGRPGVLLAVEVAYDAFPRGLAVVDAATGALVWRWECGPNLLTGQVLVTDLEGDGRQEIVAYGGAPGNLGGQEVNGTSDDRAHLFVVSERGELLVDRVLGPERFAGALAVADLDGDGRREIVTYSCSGNPGVSNVLAVWDGPTGAIRAQSRGVPGFLGLAILPAPEPGASWLITGTDDGTVLRLRFEGTALVEDRRLVSDAGTCHVLGAVALTDGSSRRVLVDVGRGASLAMLSADLEPQAVAADGLDHALLRAWAWPQPEGRAPVLAALGDFDWFVLRLTPRTPWQRYGADYGRPALAGAAVLAAFAVGVGLGRRRRPRARRPGTAAGQPDRHRLRTVLQELQETGHGTLGVTRGLRRLVMLATAGGGLADPAVRTRFDEVRAEVEASVLARLRGVAALANEAGFAPAVTGAAAAAVERFAAALGAVAAAAEPASGDLAALEREQQQVEAGFGQLRREVSAYFTADLARMLRGMVLVREIDFARAGVEVRLEAPPAAPCLIDAADLRFVLDNLLDNATRAMGESGGGQLAIVVVPCAGADTVVTVTDSGPGIPEARRAALFTGRGARRGGGLGLARSRELMHRWRGEISLAEPQPDQGAAFVLTLPTVPGDGA